MGLHNAGPISSQSYAGEGTQRLTSPYWTIGLAMEPVRGDRDLLSLQPGSNAALFLYFRERNTLSLGSSPSLPLCIYSPQRLTNHHLLNKHSPQSFLIRWVLWTFKKSVHDITEWEKCQDSSTRIRKLYEFVENCWVRNFSKDVHQIAHWNWADLLQKLSN